MTGKRGRRKAVAKGKSKSACCSTDILKEICGRIHVCASHLNSGLFAFVIKYAYLFIHLFKCFYHKNAIGRGRSAMRAP